MYVWAKVFGKLLQKRNTRTKMAALNFGGLQETPTKALHVIDQKFTSE